MISCLSDKHLERLAKIGYVTILFEKYFKKYRKQNKFINYVDINIVNVDKIPQESRDHISTLLGSDWEKHSVAVTLIELLIYRNEDENDINTLVREISSVMYVPLNTVIKIAEKCRSSRDMRFCVKFILRHEFGHIKDQMESIGDPIITAESEIYRRKSEYIAYRNKYLVNGSIDTMTQWLDINNLDIEKGANKYGHITKKELIRFFNIFSSK